MTHSTALVLSNTLIRSFLMILSAFVTHSSVMVSLVRNDSFLASGSLHFYDSFANLGSLVKHDSFYWIGSL